MTDFERNEFRIPITQELAIDAGIVGPLGAWPPDEYNRRWHTRPKTTLLFWRVPPPWEHVDRPLDFKVDPFPGLTRLERTVRAWTTETANAVADALRRLADRLSPSGDEWS